MARRKNVKRIDPRYFLNETVNRNDDGAVLGESGADVNAAGLGGIVLKDPQALIARVKELMAADEITSETFDTIKRALNKAKGDAQDDHRLKLDLDNVIMRLIGIGIVDGWIDHDSREGRGPARRLGLHSTIGDWGTPKQSAEYKEGLRRWAAASARA